MKDLEFIYLTREECDLTDYNLTISTFTRLKPYYVIHTAARVGGLFANMNDKVGFFEQNLAINNNVIKACYTVKVRTLVCLLSTCIYPDKNESYPISEDSLH